MSGGVGDYCPIVQPAERRSLEPHVGGSSPPGAAGHDGPSLLVTDRLHLTFTDTGGHALLAQSVEAIDLGSIQCGFESRGGHSGRMHITPLLTASSLLDLRPTSMVDSSSQLHHQARVPQSVEGPASKAVQSGFESRGEYLCA